MSANPIQQAIQMWMQMYADETDPRAMMGPNEGTPGPASVNPVVAPLFDPPPPILRYNTPEKERNAIMRAALDREMQQLEMKENQWTPKVYPLRRLNPDMWRYLDQLKGRGAGEERYLEPDTPDPIGKMIPQVIQQLASSPQAGGLLTRLAGMIPNQPLINEQAEPSNLFYRKGVDIYDPDFQKGTIQEVAPPTDWLDPEMEILMQRRMYSPPDAQDRKTMPGEEEETEEIIEQGI